MATREFVNPWNAVSIKTILVTLALVFGVITLLAYLAGWGELTGVYGFVGVALIAQAAFYAIM